MNTDATSPARVLPFVPRGGLTFGIYHGGVLEASPELATGKPDLPEEVNRALDRLQSGRQFLVRTYIRFTGSNADTDGLLNQITSMADLARYTWNGRKLDLVLSNWDRTGNMTRWATFIENAIERFGEYVQNFQICDEPNVFEFPGDGRFGHSVEAVLVGVRAARDGLRKLNLTAAVGFNAVPNLDLDNGFWRGISKQMNSEFLNALDYVGLNLYVDVAEPVAGEVEDAVEQTLRQFRTGRLVEAGIPATVPMHICENGWPTGPNRFYTRQADVLQEIVRKVYELRNILNITQFELFSLRDADTSNPDIGRQFGIMRDDYTPKPAFDTYRRLIQELGS
jgi:hypothetical protein